MDARFARYIVHVIGLVLAIGAAARTPAAAATLPAGFTESQVASGLASPTAMQFAPDGRLFVCEQGGRLRVIKNGALLPTPFVTLTVNASGERGLLGVAFDPNFASNQFVYVYYTATTPTVHNRISRFTANGDVAVPGSEIVILELDNLSSATNHNGGALHFGPDGKLYVAVGENANGVNAQTLSNLLGKMLRINADGTIPTDNPFFSHGDRQQPRDLGARPAQPVHVRVQPGTGRMFINDVGQNTWEEINDGIAGANYGWPTPKGRRPTRGSRRPRYAYDHAGAAAARSPAARSTPRSTRAVPVRLRRRLLLRRLSAAAGSGGSIPAPATPSRASRPAFRLPVDLKVADDGSLYYLARGTGRVDRRRLSRQLRRGAPTHHDAAGEPDRRGRARRSPSACGASGAAPLRYQWQRNGANIAGATAQDYTIAVGRAVGQRRAVPRRRHATTSARDQQRGDADRHGEPGADRRRSSQPAAGTLYSGGNVITYSGTATDPEDGTLPASAFTWHVDFHHDTHTHPFIAADDRRDAAGRSRSRRRARRRRTSGIAST